MTAQRACSQCGGSLAADYQEGLCPRCLLELALADDTSDGGDQPTKRLEQESTTEFPERIGPYKILEVLGEGGMGVVYLAQQAKPIRRRVALKVIKLGMDTKQVIARFEAERQALALMNHPNIAKVLEAGSTEQGRPYFVMEYVAGTPITKYCDQNRLTTGERLRLYIQICNAVQHAHQKGIIHRDIKPSNVLVEVRDNQPAPRIIDFGLAKATSQRLTEKTVFTQQGVLLGTPAYMSPEQAGLGRLDVDTTTDIYSLGVLLYELLVGAPPFDDRALLEAGYLEMARIIQEEDPPSLSRRLQSLGDTATDVARKRRSDLGRLSSQLKGDLEWVTRKALEKDRTRRYSSASELSTDIERHFNHEPVMAGSPGLGYRLTKFTRRHRTFVGSALIILLVITGFSILAIALFLQLKQPAAELRANNTYWESEPLIAALQAEMSWRRRDF